MTVCDLKVGQKGIIDNIYGNEKLVKSKLIIDLYSFAAGQQEDKFPTSKLEAEEKLLSGVPLAI